MLFYLLLFPDSTFSDVHQLSTDILKTLQHDVALATMEVLLCWVIQKIYISRV